MDSTKQAIRWGIPGWIFVFYFFFFQLIGVFLNNFIVLHRNFTFFDLLNLFSKMGNSFGTTIVLVISILGIPIGYIIYQIYFASSRNFSLDLEFLYLDFFKLDASSQKKINEYFLDWSLISSNLKKGEEKYFMKRIGIYRFKSFLSFLITCLDSIVYGFKKLDQRKTKDYLSYKEIEWVVINSRWLKTKSLKKEEKEKDIHLADIYHSLGAASYACLLACLLHFISILKDTASILYIRDSIVIDLMSKINYFTRKLLFSEALILLISILITLISYYFFHTNRRNCVIQKILHMIESGKMNEIQ